MLHDDGKPAGGQTATDNAIIDFTGDIEEQTPGLENLQRIKQTWTPRGLAVAWFGAVLISFGVSYDTQMVGSLQPYATSSFAAAPMLGTIAVVQSVVESVMQNPLAKLADVYGRFELFSACIVIVTIGEIMLATSQNISTYAGAQIFFIVGVIGLKLMLQLFAGDSSDLRNRALMSMVPYGPGILTCWTASYVVAAILKDTSWRWGYGIFAIIFPVVSIPLLVTLYLSQRKSKKQHPYRQKHTIKSQLRALVKLDPVGLLLFAAGLSLILVPITISTTATNDWGSPRIIVMLVIGVLALVAFVVWELKWAKYQMMATRLLKNRVVIFSMLAGILDYAALYAYLAYFLSYLVVTGGLSIKAATNVNVTWSFTAVFGQLGAGLLVKYLGRYKWIVVPGMCLKVLGLGLTFRYRDASENLAALVVSQVLYGAGSGVFLLLQTGVQASVPQNDMASATALFITSCSVGSAIGGAISGGVWTNVLPNGLEAYLPAELASQIPAIESSVVAAMSVPWGSTVRVAINAAYDDTIRVLMIVALCLEACALVSTLIVTDFNLKTIDATREYGGVVIGKTREANTAIHGRELDAMAKEGDRHVPVDNSTEKSVE